MNERNRFALVTPYFKEERHVLERCVRSVQAQQLPVEHFLIADGHPQAWLDSEPVRHIKLDRAHANAGNTPRGLGALLAISEGCLGAGFLDADNWLEPSHTRLCDEAARANPHCDYIVTRRNFYRPDGSLLEVEDIPVNIHIDTNCFFLLPGAFHMAPYYALMPFEFGPIGDRIFYAAMRSRKLNGVMLGQKTVNYVTLWPSDYLRAGAPVPPEATRAIDSKWFAEWMRTHSPRDLEILYRRCGMMGRLNIVHSDD